MIKLIAAVLARSALLCIAGLLLWATLPALAGWETTVVMSGSMRPAIDPGDVVVTRPVPAAELRPGQVVLVDDPDQPGKLRLHRVEGFTSDGRLRLHGDANATADSTPVRVEAVHGIGALCVSFVGSPVVWLHDGEYWRPALAGVAFVLLVGLARQPSGRAGTAGAVVPAGVGTGVGRGGARRRRRQGRPVLAATSTAVVLLLAVGSVAAAVWPRTEARFVTASPNGGNVFGAATSFSTYRAAVLATSPYLYWRLAEASGSAFDDSGNSRTGSYGTGLTRNAGSALTNDPNPAITLNGSTSSHVVASTSTAASGNFSIEVWFKTSGSAGGRLIGFGSNSSGTSPIICRQLYLGDDGKLVFGYLDGFTGKPTISSTAAYNDQKWHHAVGTLSGTTLRLYVDGAQVASGNTLLGIPNNTGYWRLGYDAIPGGFGGWPNAPAGAFNGSLDEAAVYTSTLSAAQVTAHWNAR